MTPRLKRAFEAEMAEAGQLYRQGQLSQAFMHVETAHVLGQRYVIAHIASHWLTLKIGWRRPSFANSRMNEPS